MRKRKVKKIKNIDLTQNILKEIELNAKEEFKKGNTKIEISTEKLILLCRTLNSERFKLSQLNKKYSTLKREIKNNAADT